VSRSRWPFDDRLPNFALNSNRVHDLYLRIHSTRSLQVPLLLSTVSQLAEKRYKEDIIQALYYGAIVVIAIYNLLVCLGTGLRVYGYYVGF